MLDRIVLIDDESIELKLHQMLLKKVPDLNAETVAFNSEEEAKDFLINVSGEEATLVIADVRMPRQDGFDLIEEVVKARNGDIGRVVFVLLTASHNPRDTKRFESLPYIHEYLVKPLTTEKLQDLINDYFAVV